MTVLVDGKINDRWDLRLTPDRAEFHRLRPGWEAERLSAMYEQVSPGQCVWDLGAESGDFTALYKQWVGAEGCVVPVEPSPLMWPQLRAHWEGNGCGPLEHRLVGFISDQDRTAPEPDPAAYREPFVEDDGWPACSVGEVVPDPGFRHLSGQPDMYHQWTIDTLASMSPSPDHIVMDIEGAEWHGLAGARECLEVVRPLVWVSVHPVPLKEWYGKEPVDIHLLMKDYGYQGTFLGLCTEELWLFAPR